LVDRAAAGELFRAHLRGTGRHGGPLWALLVLAHWAERYLGPAPPAPPRLPPSPVGAPLSKYVDTAVNRQPAGTTRPANPRPPRPGVPPAILRLKPLSSH